MLPLVVNADSNAETRNAVSSILSNEEVQVVEVNSAEQCLTVTQTTPPDLVIIAPAFRDGKGIDLCRELSYSSGALRLLRIEGAAPEAPADAYIADPPDPVTLRALVRSLLRLRTSDQERKAALEEISVARQEMRLCIGRVNHDLAEMLRNMSILIELFRSGSKLADGNAVLLDTAMTAADRCRQMLHDLVSYAQIPLEPLSSHHPVDLMGVFAAAQIQLRDLLEAAEADVRAEGLPMSMGNPARLQQLFASLLSNAVKFRANGAKPVVHVTATQESDDWWKIGVHDNGPGIAAAYQESIFAPFQRLHGRDVPGAGMGLALSRRIVQAHGGRMWVESETGKGATFFLTLPAASEARRSR